MLKIGIVGSISTVDRIMKLSETFKSDHDVEFICFSYNSVQDTRRIVEENNHYIAIWLFSGKLSYLIARDALPADDHLVYVQTTEANLYRCFLEIGHDYNNSVTSVSIDDNDTETINEAMTQLNFDFGKVFIKTYDVETEIEELYQYHLSLYQEGKVGAVITSFERVYQNLIENDVPAYWYTMSNTEIKQAFQMLREKVRTLYFKDSQIGIVMADVERFYEIAEAARSPYQLQYIELNIKEKLIEVCQSLNGSLLEKGNGRYSIFSSRGTIEKNIAGIQKLKQVLHDIHNITMTIGIGFGETAFSAELNAIQALRQNEERIHSDSIMIQDEGEVVEASGDKSRLSFSTISSDDEISKKLKAVNISLRTFNKVIGMLNSAGKQEFTSTDLVTHLHIEPRNSRRIVKQLNAAGLIEYVGEQSSQTKGRPKKVYRIARLQQ
jgi:hypothetical protein